MPDLPDLHESAWRRAKREPVAVYGTWAFQLASAIVFLIAAAVGLLLTDNDAPTEKKIAATVLVGAIALALTYLIALVTKAVTVPVSQRDDLRRAWPIDDQLASGEPPEDRELRQCAVLTRADLLDCDHLIRRAYDDNKWWPHGGLPSNKWGACETKLAADPRASTAYESVSNAFRWIAPLHDRAVEAQEQFTAAKGWIEGAAIASLTEQERLRMAEASVLIEAATRDLNELLEVIGSDT